MSTITENKYNEMLEDVELGNDYIESYCKWCQEKDIGNCTECAIHKHRDNKEVEE